MPTRRRAFLILAALVCLALLSLALALSAGSFRISPGEIFSALFGGEHSTPAEILRSLRLPRALAGFACGGAAGDFRRPAASSAAQSARRPIRARHLRRRRRRRHPGHSARPRRDRHLRRILCRRAGGHAHRLRTGARRRQLDADAAAAHRRHRRRRLRRVDRPDAIDLPGSQTARHAFLVDGRSVASVQPAADAGRSRYRTGADTALRPRTEPADARRRPCPDARRARRSAAPPGSMSSPRWPRPPPSPRPAPSDSSDWSCRT